MNSLWILENFGQFSHMCNSARILCSFCFFIQDVLLYVLIANIMQDGKDRGKNLPKRIFTLQSSTEEASKFMQNSCQFHGKRHIQSLSGHQESTSNNFFGQHLSVLSVLWLAILVDH